MVDSISNHRRSPEQIQHDMQTTRQRIDQSVDRLEAKLSPEKLLSSAERWLTGGRVSEGGPLTDHIAAIVRGYPLPSALVAAAAAWVILDRFLAGSKPHADGLTPGRATGGSAGSGVGDAVRTAAHAVGDATMGLAGAVKHTGQAVGSGIGSAGSAVGQAAGYAAHSVGGAASTAAHAVGDAVSYGAHSVGHAAEWVGHSASSSASAIGHGVASGARFTHNGLSSAYKAYPIGMGLVATGCGLALGLLIPSTHVEDRMLGHASDKAKDGASKVGGKVKKQLRETGKELKHAGGDVIREIKAEVRGEGTNAQAPEASSPY